MYDAVVLSEKLSITHSGKDCDEYDTALDYLKDVQELSTFYINILKRDDKTLNAIIPEELQMAKAVRNLVFGAAMLDPVNDFDFQKVSGRFRESCCVFLGTDTDTLAQQFESKLHALFCYITGVVKSGHAKCASCKG